MKIYSLDTVSLEQLDETLRKEFDVYGDLQKFLTVRPHDLPSKFSASIMSVASLYDNLMRIYENLLQSYLALALLRKGYIDESLEESGLSHEDMVWHYRDAAVTGGGEEVQESLDFSKAYDPTDYVSIHLIRDRPMLDPDGHLSFSVEWATDRLIQDISHNTNEGKMQHTASYIIPDPFLFRLFKEKMYETKKRLKSELPGWEFLSVEEFVDRYLSDEQKDYRGEFRDLINSAKRHIEKKFPFLSVSRQLQEISRARKEIQDSVHRSREPDRYETEDIIRKATLGVERLLYAIYWKIFNEEPK
ncbi:hypothetical protein Thermo_00796 [Thermoplasmatales archaeon]|nr:hypothetical protein Thermo_00796 [Thermoplasmatales archaeon]